MANTTSQSSEVPLGLTVSFQPGREQVDWTGCTARLQARNKHSSADVLFAMTTENGGLEMDGPAGKLRLVMTAAAAAAATLEFTKAVYDLEIVPTGNEPYRLFKGTSS